jgi:hypothetical protein
MLSFPLALVRPALQAVPLLPELVPAKVGFYYTLGAPNGAIVCVY